MLASLHTAGGTPANDGFSSALELSGAPVATTGNNSGATMEPGEWNPGEMGGASVWYRWVAPASAWYEITTFSEDPSHDLDTVVALFASGVSGSLVDATVLGFNDDSLTFPGRQSRLVFHAVMGTDYRIAVHGYDGETGAFRLAINPIPQPSLVVTSVEFSPPAVDVGAGEASTTVTVNIQSAVPFEGGFLTLYTPFDSFWIDDIWLDEGSRTSGTPLSGTYEANLTVQAYRAPGLYPIEAFLWTEEDDFNWSPTGPDRIEDHYLIPAGGRLQVINTGQVDSAAPALLSLDTIPPVVDIGEGDVWLPVTARITDDLSGFVYADIRLLSDDRSRNIGYFDDDTLISGTVLDGIHETELRFRGTLPLGTYWLTVRLEDALGNWVTYGGPDGQPLPEGVPSTIVLTGTGPANDAFADRVVLGPENLPDITGSTALATLEPGEPDLHGDAGGSVWYQWTATADGWMSVEISSQTGRNFIGLFTGVDVSALSEIGRAEENRLVFLAEAGQTYQIGVFSPRGFGGGAFTLTLAPLEAPPALRVMQVSLTPGMVDVGTGPRTVIVELTIESDTPLLPDFFGFSSLSASLHPARSPFGRFPINVTFDPTHRVAGSTTNGTYRQEIQLPPFMEPADWFLRVNGSLPGAGAFRWSAQGGDPMYDEYLIPSGGGTLNVLNTGLIDTEPPALTSFTGLPSLINLSAGPVTVTFTFGVEDEGGGFESAFISFYRSDAPGSTFFVGLSDASNRISGDANSGIYQTSFTFGEFVPPGEYTFVVDLRDQSGNQRSYRMGQAQFPPDSAFTVRVINEATGYLGWAASQDFGPSNRNGPLQDANGDGVPNLLGYAFNIPPFGVPARAMTPGHGDTSGLPAISVVGEGSERRLRVEFIRRFTEGNQLTYTVQFGSNPSSDMEDFTGDFESSFINPDWIRLVAFDPVVGADRRFARVRVDLQ